MGNFFFFPGRCDDYILCGAHNTTGFKEKNSNTKTAVALSLLPHDVRCIQHKRVGPYTIRVSTPPPPRTVTPACGVRGSVVGGWVEAKRDVTLREKTWPYTNGRAPWTTTGRNRFRSGGGRGKNNDVVGRHTCGARPGSGLNRSRGSNHSKSFWLGHHPTRKPYFERSRDIPNRPSRYI